MRELRTDQISADICYQSRAVCRTFYQQNFMADKISQLGKYSAKYESGLIVVANHQTYFDPFWICFKIHRKFRFMAWDKAFEWFLIGRFIRYLGAFPVSLERGGTVKTLKQTLAALRDGATLVIFPEGSREFSDGKMLEFKTGAARLAIEANVPILPVTVRGGNQVWAQDIKFPRLGKKSKLFIIRCWKLED